MRYRSGKVWDLVRNEQGIALLTVMLIMLMMSVLGLAAIAVTGFENRMAGFAMNGESATTAAESGLSTSVNIIQQSIDQGGIPTGYSPSIIPAAALTGPPTLYAEIQGGADNNGDSVTGSGAAGPDVVLSNVGQYTVNCDIDRLYTKAKSGSGLQFAGGYEGVGGGASGGGVDVLYQIDCGTTLTATGVTSRVVAIYACSLTGETCQKKL